MTQKITKKVIIIDFFCLFLLKYCYFWLGYSSFYMVRGENSNAVGAYAVGAFPREVPLKVK